LLLQNIQFDTFDPSYGLVVFSMAVIGGLGSISGTLMGVGLIEVLSYWQPKYQLVFTGVGLLIILLFLPGGLGDGVQRVRDRILKLIAVRRDILVPSLVADKRVEVHHLHPPEETGLLEHALGDDEEPVTPDELVHAEFVDADVDTGETPAVTAQTPAATNGHVPDTPVLLSCQQVEVSYGPVQILFGVDLDVHEGEIVALLGTNGAGKSTLLKGAAGLVKVGG